MMHGKDDANCNTKEKICMCSSKGPPSWRFYFIYGAFKKFDYGILRRPAGQTDEGWCISVEPSQAVIIYYSLCQTLLTARSVHLISPTSTSMRQGKISQPPKKQLLLVMMEVLWPSEVQKVSKLVVSWPATQKVNLTTRLDNKFILWNIFKVTLTDRCCRVTLWPP